jgi:asparagine synthase (glutamine-hydrolysing)
MCGITGIWTQHNDQDRIRAEVKEAVASLRHTGPDDEGTWMNGLGVALGHTRLSILDLSEFGHQPMVSNDGRYVIVFNGEIYNFAEVRTSLNGPKHVLKVYYNDTYRVNSSTVQSRDSQSYLIPGSKQT